MISNELTYNSFGYFPLDLSMDSHKKIIAICDNCGKVRSIQKKAYRNLCHSCSESNRWKERKVILEKELLESLYYGNELYIRDISKLCKCSQSTICNLMEKYNIKRRTNSEAHKGLQIRENNPNWKGGITPITVKIRESKEYDNWRKNIYKRDNYICQVCKNGSNLLNVHHIYNFIDYPDLRLEITNGITICNKCHLEFHSLYGKRNNTLEQLELFINNRGIK